MRKWALPVAMVALLGALMASLLQRNVAPEVVFTLLDGKQVSTKDLRGKVLLVNFWATTCPGCVAEMPQLIETYQHYRAQGFELVAVAMAYDPPANVARFTQQHALPFSVALDTDGRVASAFHDVQLTPTAFVIDRQGRIVSHVVGELDFSALRQLLLQELGSRS